MSSGEKSKGFRQRKRASANREAQCYDPDVRSLRIDGETDDEFLKRAERVAQYAKVLVDACLENECVKQYVVDPEQPFTEQGIRANPIVRLDFEHAFAIGGIGETLAATRNKSWGEGPFLLPLDQDDWFFPDRITYQYKESSPYNRRFLLRQQMKQLLGRKFRTLVTRAKRSNKGEFLQSLSTRERFAIATALEIDPVIFWRAAKGRAEPEIPPVLTQGELFPEEAERFLQ